MADFVKSSYSSDTWNCVEVAKDEDEVLVRDSKNLEGPVLTFSRDSWNAFIKELCSRPS